MILGLDISTSCIGWTTLDDNGIFLNIGYIDLKKKKNFYEKAEAFRAFLQTIQKHKANLDVFIEEPLKAFQAQKSMAQTISLLQRFNAVCCYLVYSELGLQPSLIMERSARKLANIEVPKKVKGKDKKMFVLKTIQNSKIIPNEKWSYKKTGLPKDWCFDMADSYVIAYAGFQRLNGLRE